MSANITQQIIKRLVNGAVLTSDSIKTEFGCVNPSMMISHIESKGVPVDRARIGRNVAYTISRNIGTTDRVRARLLSGETLNTDQISHDYGIGSPGSVIYELRKRGMKINTSRAMSAFGGNIAHYSM